MFGVAARGGSEKPQRPIYSDKKDFVDGPIPQEFLESVACYEYVSGGYSPLDNILNYEWEAMAKLMPSFLAPNLITLTGLVCNIVGLFLTWYYNPTLAGDSPRWVYLVVAVLQHVYMCLDAVDGKQARATKSSSALGQLFDHVCDSVGTVFILLPTFSAIRLGCSVETLIALALVQIPFFLAQWVEFHTGILRTHIGIVGVTEGAALLQALLCLSWAFGSEIWVVAVESNKFTPGFVAALVEGTFVGSLPLNVLLVCLIFCTNMFLIVSNIIEVVQNIDNHKKHHVFGTQKSVSLAAAFLDLAPFCVLVISGLMLRFTKGFEQIPWIGFLSLGMIFSHLCSQMIVSALTHMPFSKAQWALLPLPFLVLNGHLTQPVFDEVVGLQIYCVYVAVCVLRWILGIVYQIAGFLGINVLVLQKRDNYEYRQKVAERIRRMRSRER